MADAATTPLDVSPVLPTADDIAPDPAKARFPRKPIVGFIEPGSPEERDVIDSIRTIATGDAREIPRYRGSFPNPMGTYIEAQERKKNRQKAIMVLAYCTIIFLFWDVFAKIEVSIQRVMDQMDHSEDAITYKLDSMITLAAKNIWMFAMSKHGISHYSSDMAHTNASVPIPPHLPGQSHHSHFVEVLQAALKVSLRPMSHGCVKSSSGVTGVPESEYSKEIIEAIENSLERLIHEELEKMKEKHHPVEPTAPIPIPPKPEEPATHHGL